MLRTLTKIAGLLSILFLSMHTYAQLTLDNIFLTDKYIARQAYDFTFLHTKPQYARLFGQHISFYNDKNEKSGELKLKADVPYSWDALSYSSSDQYFLVRSNCNQVYRRSFECSYFMGDTSGALTPLSSGAQLYPDFSPDEKKIAFIKGNNLFYKEIATGKEVSVTNDGKWNYIINGKSDWVYEEELELTQAYRWSGTSNQIAYLKFDESNVKESSIPMYYDLQYPNLFSYKYPKVGEQNSKVSAWLYDLKSGKNRQIPIPFSYEYIPRLYWNATDDEVVMLLMNRQQDTLRLAGYNIKTKQTRQIYLETSKTNLDIPLWVYFFGDNSFLISSERDGYNHLYRFDKDGKLLQQLPKGEYEVTSIYGIDGKNHLLYYQSNEGNATQTSIYAVNYQTLEKRKISKENGSNKADFAYDFSYFLHTYSNANTPYKITLEHIADTMTTVVEDNKDILDTLKDFPKKEFIKIPVGNIELNAWIIKPKNIDSTKRYPLLMYAYGGPGTQEVLDEWSPTRNLFFNYLAENGIAVACVDNRGTPGRGKVFKDYSFLNLGKIETIDQIASAKYLSTLSFIDKDRIGFFGWSYGGYLASLCLMEGSNVFKSAIAVAPTASWKLYDAVYAEKYMRTPGQNPDGYHYNPLNLVSKLKGNLMLIHGMADDNVQFQHTIFLINALNAANKKYTLLVYPDKEHSITGRKTRYDLFLRIADFLKEKL